MRVSDTTGSYDLNTRRECDHEICSSRRPYLKRASDSFCATITHVGNLFSFFLFVKYSSHKFLKNQLHLNFSRKILVLMATVKLSSYLPSHLLKTLTLRTFT